MALVYSDRTKDTSTTTGTGTYTLSNSAPTGFQTFGNGVGDGNTCEYTATDGTDWEVGLGTYTAAGTTLARTLVQASSNSNAAVNWGAGTRTLWVDYPASVATTLNSPITASNIGLAATVATNALTIALKGANGSDPSPRNPVTVPFRSATAATGTPSTLTVTAATSLVISSGSTMGFTSAVAGRLWIVAFNDAGTFRLGAVNALSGTSIMALIEGIYSSTAEGGAGGADSAQVIYTGTAVTSKALTILGYLEATEATAGTWASTPSTIQVFGPDVPRPGQVVQTFSTEFSTSSTGTTVLPADNTIPQNTEGTQFMTNSIGPTSGANILEVEATAFYGSSATAFIGQALFRDSTANAVAVSSGSVQSTGLSVDLSIFHRELASSTSSTTFNIRTGPHTAATVTFGGNAGTRQYGATPFGRMTVSEVMA